MKTNFFEDEFEEDMQDNVNLDEKRYLVTLNNGVSYTWNDTELDEYKKTYDNSTIKEIIEI